MAADAHAYLAIDQGGSATRVAVLDRSGSLRHLARRALQTQRGARGEVTHDARRLIGDLDDALCEAIEAAHALGLPITAAGLSCQRASVVAFDADSLEPLSDVLSWQDTRAADLLVAAQLDADEVLVRTGMYPTAFHGASKLRWLQEAIPARGGGRRMLAPLASFLAARLGGRVCCPATIAQRSLLFDRQAGAWSDLLLAQFGLHRDVLPPVCADVADFGVIERAGARIPLRVVAGDQNLLVAARRLSATQGHLNLGTGAFLLLDAVGGTAPTRIQASLAPGPRLGSGCFVEATVHGAAAALDWLRDRPGMPNSLPWQALNEVRDDDPCFANAVGGIGSPWWIADREPAFSTTPRDAGAALRAVVDSLAALLRVNLDAVAGGAVRPPRLRVSGGLTHQAGLIRRLADTLGVVLQVDDEAELSLRGLWHLLDGRAAASDVAGSEVAPGAHAAWASARYLRWRQFMATWDARCTH